MRDGGPGRPDASGRPCPAAPAPAGGEGLGLALAAGAVALLAVLSTFVGVGELDPRAVVAGDLDERAREVLLVSRLPRTMAIALTGAALAIAGMVMQMMLRNRYVEPSTAGTAEAAALGLVVAVLALPGAPLIAKMGVGTLFALAGTALLLQLLRMVPVRDVLMVPVLGLMLGGVINAATTFLAYRHDLLQSVNAWTTGDFSGVLRGRYELLWLVAAAALVAYVVADRFTVAGMGRDVATSLGMAYGAVLAVGLGLVAVVTAVVVVTVGTIPFLGLIVPNIVSMTVGDNVRRAVPWVAVLGAGAVLACDIVGRLVRYPFEVPIGTVVGVIGSAVFLYLLLRRSPRVA